MNNLLKHVNEHVRALPAYQAGQPIATVARQLGLELSGIIKLASNENPAGMSPLARARLESEVQAANRYPDADHYELRQAIGQRVGLSPDQVLPGAGSSELITLAARAMLGPGLSAVLSQYAFVCYAAAIQAEGATAVIVPAQAYAHDLPAMREAAIKSEARLVFVASPNNPTGTCSSPEALGEFLSAIPDDVLIVLDEAYREFMPAAQQPDTRALLAQHPNLLILRTFSKVYGMAALRVGYGLGDAALIGILRRLQAPFSVSSAAQDAAIAALGDRQFVEQCVADNARERGRLSAALAGLHIEHLPSHGNFILLRVGDGERTYQSLLRQGVITRTVGGYGLPEWLRVTVGLPAENDRFIEALGKARLPDGVAHE